MEPRETDEVTEKKLPAEVLEEEDTTEADEEPDSDLDDDSSDDEEDLGTQAY